MPSDTFAAGIEAAVRVADQFAESPYTGNTDESRFRHEGIVAASRLIARDLRALTPTDTDTAIPAGEHMRCPWCRSPAVVVKSPQASTWRAGCDKIGVCTVLPYCVGETIAEAWTMWDAASPKPDTDTTVYPGVEGVDIADAHRFLTLSSGFSHMPATDGKRIAGFFYSNDAAEAADAMPAHAMSAIKRIIAALAAKPIAGMDAGEEITDLQMRLLESIADSPRTLHDVRQAVRASLRIIRHANNQPDGKTPHGD